MFVTSTAQYHYDKSDRTFSAEASTLGIAHEFPPVIHVKSVKTGVTKRFTMRKKFFSDENELTHVEYVNVDHMNLVIWND